jgi:hypothetical protein
VQTARRWPQGLFGGERSLLTFVLPLVLVDQLQSRIPHVWRATVVGRCRMPAGKGHQGLEP